MDAMDPRRRSQPPVQPPHLVRPTPALVRALRLISPGLVRALPGPDFNPMGQGGSLSSLVSLSSAEPGTWGLSCVYYDYYYGVHSIEYTEYE